MSEVPEVEAGPVWEAILHRRAIRRFADRPLEPAHVERILAAGRRSGSSKNQQRWDFIVCRDRDHLRELSVVGPWAGHLAGAAVAIALVTPDPRSTEAPLSVMFDLGQAAANMQLAAGSKASGPAPPPSTTTTLPGACWDSRRTATASSFSRSAIPPTRASSRRRSGPAVAARSAS